MLHSLHPEHLVVAQHLQTPWECPEMQGPFSLWPRCYVSHALSRDGHRRSKARRRVLLLYHLFASVEAPKNIGAHAMSTDIKSARPAFR
jgi:hypothetical protein